MARPRVDPGSNTSMSALNDYERKAEWIRWVDIVAFCHGWVEFCPGGYPTTTVDTLGFVLSEDEHTVQIVQSIDPMNYKTMSIMSIPKIAIIKRWTIR